MIVVSLISWVLAACFNAAMDTLIHKYNISVFYRSHPRWDSFWNPLRSWKRKYRDNDKWYGWINDTVLVWTTDAWHLFQMLMKLSIMISIVTYQTLITWYWDILIFTIIWGLIFEVLYKYLLVNRIGK